MLFETSRNSVSNTSGNDAKILKQLFVSKQFMCFEPISFLVYTCSQRLVLKNSKHIARKNSTADFLLGPLFSTVLTPCANF